jgi:intracellular sulfur oxidation DsrE/DsrF family protein
MSIQSPSSPERRSFLTRLNAGAASLAAVAFGGVAMAQQKSVSAVRFEPARHEKDDWFDQLPGKHRLVFDTTAWDGLGDAILFSNNFIRVNKADYGVESKDLAVVVVVRHRSTPFGYNDAMWAKYGAPIAARAKVEDPKSKQIPKLNFYNSTDYAEQLANRDTTLDALFKLGVLLAVCGTSTRGYATSIAQATGGKVDDIFAELSANLVSKSNARLVPAGIVAVSRAQERGYTLVSLAA